MWVDFRAIQFIPFLSFTKILGKGFSSFVATPTMAPTMAPTTATAPTTPPTMRADLRLHLWSISTIVTVWVSTFQSRCYSQLSWILNFFNYVRSQMSLIAHSVDSGLPSVYVAHGCIILQNTVFISDRTREYQTFVINFTSTQFHASKFYTWYQ